MKTLRKVLSVVLAQVLILTYLPISVSAEDEIDSDENEITEYTEEYEPEEIADDQEIMGICKQITSGWIWTEEFVRENSNNAGS